MNASVSSKCHVSNCLLFVVLSIIHEATLWWPTAMLPTEIASLRSHYEVLTTDNNKTAPSSSTRGNEISLLPVKTLSHRTNSDYGLAYLGISASKHQFHKNVSLLLQAQLNSRKNLRTAFPFWRLLFEMI